MADFNINENVQELLRVFDTDCIIADKVFTSCQQRKCFPQIEVEICNGTFGRVRFRPGFIVPGTLIITDIESQPNFRRVRFTIRIPYEVLDTNGNVIAEAFLPDILKDIILFIPDSRDEFEFRIVIETKSEVLAPPVQTEGTLSFAVGTFIIVKVVGTVQLLIPVYGYCPEPSPCEEFSPTDICDMFDYEDFPEFFPCQMNDKECLENSMPKKSV